MTEGDPNVGRDCPFRFKADWTTHENFYMFLMTIGTKGEIWGRTIHHNIVVAQEMVHSMSRMKGNKMFMSIKIDLEKAYDRLN